MESICINKPSIMNVANTRSRWDSLSKFIRDSEIKKKKEGMDEVVTLWYFLSLPFFFFFVEL